MPLPPPSVQLNHPPPSFPRPLVSVPPPPLPISVPPPPLPATTGPAGGGDVSGCWPPQSALRPRVRNDADDVDDDDDSVLELVERVMHEVMSRGLFDDFRRQCLADVDTRPAYQNLHLRVVRFVRVFLRQQKWSPDLNRNQLRERMGRQLMVSQFLDSGVSRIIDQAVNRNICAEYSSRVDKLVREIVADDFRYIVSKGTDSDTDVPSRVCQPSTAKPTNNRLKSSPLLPTPILPTSTAAEESDSRLAFFTDHQFGYWCRQFRSNNPSSAQAEERQPSTPGIIVNASSPSSLSSSPPPPTVMSNSASDCQKSASASSVTLTDDTVPRITDESNASSVEHSGSKSDLVPPSDSSDPTIEPSCDVDEQNSEDDSDGDSPCVLSQMSPLSEVGADSDAVGEFEPVEEDIETVEGALQVEQSCSTSVVGSPFVSECVVDGLTTDACLTVDQLDICDDTSTVELRRDDAPKTDAVDARSSPSQDGSADECDFVGFTSEILSEDVVGDDVFVVIESDESDCDAALTVEESVECSSPVSQAVEVPVDSITSSISSPAPIAIGEATPEAESEKQVEEISSCPSGERANVSIVASTEYDTPKDNASSKTVVPNITNCVSIVDSAEIDVECRLGKDRSSQKHSQKSSRDSSSKKRNKSSGSVRHERSSSSAREHSSSRHRSRSHTSSHPSKSDHSHRRSHKSSRSSSKHRDRHRSDSRTDHKHHDSSKSDRRHESSSRSHRHKHHRHRKHSISHRQHSQSSSSTNVPESQEATSISTSSFADSISAHHQDSANVMISKSVHCQDSSSSGADVCAVETSVGNTTKSSPHPPQSDLLKRVSPQLNPKDLKPRIPPSLSPTSRSCRGVSASKKSKSVSSSRGIKRERSRSGEPQSKFLKTSDHFSPLNDRERIDASDVRLPIARVVLVRDQLLDESSRSLAKQSDLIIPSIVDEQTIGASDVPDADTGGIIDSIDPNVENSADPDVIDVDSGAVDIDLVSDSENIVAVNDENVAILHRQPFALPAHQSSPTADSVCSSVPSWSAVMSEDSSEVDEEAADMVGLKIESDVDDSDLEDEDHVNFLEGNAEEGVDWNGWSASHVPVCVEQIRSWQLARAACDVDGDGLSISSVDTDQLSEYDQLLELDVELHEEQERHALLNMGWRVASLPSSTDNAEQKCRSVCTGDEDKEVGGCASVNLDGEDKDADGHGSVSAGGGEKEPVGPSSVCAGGATSESDGCGPLVTPTVSPVRSRRRLSTVNYLKLHSGETKSGSCQSSSGSSRRSSRHCSNPKQVKSKSAIHK